MTIKTGPTGNTVRGSIWDCNPKSFEAALKRFDSDLYIQWNPKKRQKQGCWEIRIRPPMKTAIRHGEFNGQEVYSLEYKEDNLVNHVIDLPALSYQYLDYLKKIDTRLKKNWVQDYECREQAAKLATTEKMRKETTYNMMQYKTAIRDFMERVNSGVNPALLAHFWDQKTS